MKKLVLFVMAVMAFAGMSVAQDIWSSGYYNDGSNKQAAVYKNGTKMYNTSFAYAFNGDCTDVDVYGGNVYWARNCYDGSNNFHYGVVAKNGSAWWDPVSGDGSHIYDLHRSGNGNLFAAGCKDVSGVRRAAVWKNNEGATPLYTLGTSGQVSEAFGVITNGDTYVYSCGYQYTSAVNYKGVIWKGSQVFKEISNAKIYDITFFNGKFYFVGRVYENSNYKLRVWSLTSDGSSLSTVYTLVDADAADRAKICIESGDIYVCSYDGDNPDIVWKNGEELYEDSGFIHAVAANTNGVYYVGSKSGNGKIWKNGSVQYSPTNCDKLLGVFIAEPTCTNSEVRSLPFSETFENGNTSWPCWTTVDVDGNGTNLNYWHRAGQRLASLTGDYCARHAGSTNQDGWLITPRLFLQPGQQETKLTFKSWVNQTFTTGVYVSTSSDPTNINSYVRVYDGVQTSRSTQTHTVDLSAYQGQAVYIAFNYFGSLSTSWLIDNVNVTQSFSPCDPSNPPYTCDFTGGFSYWHCWTAYDVDMSPGNAYCWRHNNGSDQYMYHPWGPTGEPQEGWLFSKRVTLPTGNYNYTLSFKSKCTSSGVGKKSTVWIALDETGAPNKDHFTTKVWEDPSYSSSWTSYSVDLSPYKGHTVTVGFKYEGTCAHSWAIDDFSITQAIAQYNITANSNNNNYGTVTGGGTFNAGASCTLVATPVSGYQFDSWKKNGSVVSTSATYTFTVTENATYTAYFSQTPITYYEITTQVTPANSGTVSGGGQHPSGSTTTLTATANPGYTFAHWQDNNVQNPRTITVTGDATYTATFTQNQYQITTNVSPAGAGTVTGGGAYHYGDTPTLTATANANYEFAGWNDGNTENPRTITVTGNETYTAIFNEVGVTMFTVTANVSPAGAGTVEGTGTFEAGTNIVLEAIANPGYTFNRWQDGSTTNPRPVTVTGNMEFTAIFTQNQYIITVMANPSSAGMVSGGGAYYYGDYATLTATASSGYEFQGWSDGSTENPHQVMVTGSATYTATFAAAGSTYYTVSGYVSPLGAGTVNGTGSFPAGTSITLTAVANSGYVFDHWNDGVTENPRTVTVNNNMSFTAYFTTNQYTITVNVSPAGAGTVSGGGSYAYGDAATLTATPNTGYSFMQWSDGALANPRVVNVTGNATYTALFMSDSGETFTLTVTSGNVFMGQVTGGGVYPAGAAVEIRAIPAIYARFVQWNDGNTDNPRTVIVNDNLEFIAEFTTAQQYTITVLSSNEEWGQVLGGGTFTEGTQIEFSAIANDGYIFTGWNDGNTDNPRSITVTGDATYTAQFAVNSVTTHTLTLICNTSEGTVSGGGTYIEGSTVTIQAFPNPGYVFTKWSDDNTQNPRTVTLDNDMILVAFFATGVGENEQSMFVIYPNPAKESIRISGLEANSEVEIYNSIGELVKVVSVSSDQEINIRDLASGLYMVRFGSATLRFVKEQ